MGYWKSLDLLRNDNRNCFQRAFLEVRTKDGMKKMPFTYTTISDDTLTDTESAMPMNFDKRTKGIFVTKYWLPFVSNARIQFKDGSTMTVTSTTKVVDEQKALTDGEGIIGLNVYLGG